MPYDKLLYDLLVYRILTSFTYRISQWKLQAVLEIGINRESKGVQGSTREYKGVQESTKEYKGLIINHFQNDHKKTTFRMLYDKIPTMISSWYVEWRHLLITESLKRSLLRQTAYMPSHWNRIVCLPWSSKISLVTFLTERKNESHPWLIG
ncbi:uncharacterized protein LOC108109940 [Drosophila eugracilis]|uniref:uncharacterized protein LOC108109940 n=1 Tax=Drosophila eugracilis TaxID=29029 RepID=UPI0007E70C94|nr:uncharacterized protein LOC108109940 [Drosophila eugracilis]